MFIYHQLITRKLSSYLRIPASGFSYHMRTISLFRAMLHVIHTQSPVHFFPTVPTVTSNAVWEENAPKQSLSVCTPALTHTSVPITIQWYHKTFEPNAQFTQLPSQTSHTLSFQSVTKTQAGIYKAGLMISDKLIAFSTQATVRVKCEYKTSTRCSTLPPLHNCTQLTHQ